MELSGHNVLGVTENCVLPSHSIQNHPATPDREYEKVNTMA